MDYYRETLSAGRLRRAYGIAPPRVRRYLEEEVRHVLGHLSPASRVLELGCGYGRVLARIAAWSRFAVGIDTSMGSLVLARRELGQSANYRLLAMDAAQLGFADGVFDCVVCVQNGISAFRVDERRLIGEAVRVTRPGGTILLSSYAEAFWDHRLAWFRIQADEGLIGEIDEERTGRGQIVCRDGFTATTFGPERFRELTASIGVDARMIEVDGSSIFCEIAVV
ncbi:MAG TPA: class I SAM-dependent methyltransferase [Patescibacteria group bacterium]|nr:class I SAM-dependent methyltransferase [Patescibacteria group bacterium]